MILIGSRAMKWHFPDFPREPKDYDYAVAKIGENRCVKNSNGDRVELHPIKAIWKRFNHLTRDLKILSPDQIYTLKVSHSFWNVKWEKTIFDIVWLKKKGCKIDKELFDELYAHWVTVHGEPKRSNLKQSKADFFNNALMNQDKHDDLHAILKFPPTFTKILVGEVETSEEKWNLLNHEEKLDLIREETYVMAYERMAGRDYRTAYIAQLKAMILNHLPQYQALFAVDNYYELRKPLIKYHEIIKNGLRTNQSKA